MVILATNSSKTAFTLSNTVMQKEFTSALAVMEKDETEGADPAVLAKLVCSIVNKPSPAVRCLSGMALQK